MEEDLTDDFKHNLENIMKNVNEKEKLVKTLDEELVNIIDEENIDDDIKKGTELEIHVSTKINDIKSFIKKHKKDIEKDEVSSTSSRSPVIKPNINLPKLVIKKFSDNPITWQQFYDTFQAAIDKAENLSNVQKLTYLQGCLEGPALKCIKGMTLSNENYIQALKQLKDRYANPQLITSTHMSKLLKLEKVFNSKKVIKSRKPAYPKSGTRDPRLLMKPGTRKAGPLRWDGTRDPGH